VLAAISATVFLGISLRRWSHLELQTLTQRQNHKTESRRAKTFLPGGQLVRISLNRHRAQFENRGSRNTLARSGMAREWRHQKVQKIAPCLIKSTELRPITKLPPVASCKSSRTVFSLSLSLAWPHFSPERAVDRNNGHPPAAVERWESSAHTAKWNKRRPLPRLLLRKRQRAFFRTSNHPPPHPKPLLVATCVLNQPGRWMYTADGPMGHCLLHSKQTINNFQHLQLVYVYVSALMLLCEQTCKDWLSFLSTHTVEWSVYHLRLVQLCAVNSEFKICSRYLSSIKLKYTYFTFI
jgi:hypothetical protein